MTRYTMFAIGTTLLALAAGCAQMGGMFDRKAQGR